MPVDALPDELLVACLAVLSDLPLARAGCVSRRWRGLADRDALWRPMLMARWPELLFLRNVESLKALYGSRAVLLQTPPPPSTDAFQFIIVLSSVHLGVLLRKVVVGNDAMSWAVGSDDFLLMPDRRWSCGNRSFYEEDGVRVMDLVDGNGFKLSVTAFHNGKLGEMVPSVGHGISVLGDEDHIEPGTLRFDGVQAVVSSTISDHTLIYGAELIEQELLAPNPHWQAADRCGRWVRYEDEDEALGIDTTAADYPPEGFDPWEGFMWPPMELRVGTRFIDRDHEVVRYNPTSLQTDGFAKVLAGVRWV